MKRYKKLEIQALTFDEFIEFGKENADNLIGGIPYSFVFFGHCITHEHDKCYLIPTSDGRLLKFTPEDMLIIDNDNNIYPMELVRFKNNYEEIKGE